MTSISKSSSEQAVNDIFAGGGEMGELMRSIDWSQTPLGPVENWPQSLRTSLSICLASRFPILIWWGPQLVKLYNDAYRPMLGSTKHPRSMGQPGRECWPEIWDLIGPMLEGVLMQGKATWSDNQLLLLDRNGYIEECYFTFSYSPIRDETGGVGGVFTVVTETTRQVLSERRLGTLRELAVCCTEAHTAEEVCRLSAEVVARNPHDIPFALLYLLDKHGKRAQLGGSTGLPSDTPASPLIIDLTQVEEEAAQWPLTEVVATGKTVLVGNVQQRFGSSTTYLGTEGLRSGLVLPIAKPGQESLYGFLVVGISPRRALDEDYRSFFELVAGQIAANIASARAYQEERERAEALAELDRTKTAFFSNVSHEFRTPLTLLLGPVEDALADETYPLSPEQRERLEIVRRNGLRLLKLVNTLLDFSRIEAGRIQAVYEPTDLAAFTTELASTFRSAIERAGMQLIVDCPVLPEPVYVDREMWEKIVLNLLSNAFKFTFEGQIAVALHSVSDRVELEVRDTGVGIAEEELPRVFERFHRIRDTRARTFEGSGIGLALVQELVRLHGGTISATSAPGKGTIFTVSLPLGSAHLPADRVRTTHALASTVIGATPYVEEALRWLPGTADSAPVTTAEWLDQGNVHLLTQPVGVSAQEAQTPAFILVIEDNADMRDYMTHLLSRYYTIEAVEDGSTALKVIEKRLPDLVISDVMMPGLDGFQLVQAIRNNPRTGAVPVLLLSARAGEESAVEGLQAGADDYLIKPFSARELLARVRARLEMSRLRMGFAHQTQAYAHRLQQLADVALIINSMLPLEDILNLVTVHAREIIGTHQAITSLALGQEGARVMNAVSLSDKYAAWRGYHEFPDRSNLYASVCTTNSAVRMAQAELEAHPEWSSLEKEIGNYLPLRGWLAAPLIGRHGRNLGLIQLSDKYEGEFTIEDQSILVQLAQMTSVAIENTQLYKQAQDAIRARDEMFSMVTHDLKNPLSAIKGYVQLLQKSFARTALPESERVAMILPRIDATATKMTAQINELLDLAQLQLGQPLELVRSSVDLVALIQQIVKEQQSTGQHHIRMETSVKKLIGQFDAARLERVIANLLSNAVKYSAKGSTVEVQVMAQNEQGHAYAVIVVRDQGIGIPASDLPYIFEPFRRAENVAGKIKGTGIGLSSAYQIVKQHGGAITVESQEGNGSTFTVHLPLSV